MDVRKTYTNRGNCARAAKSVLGKDAKQGKDFVITGSGKEFKWSRAGQAPIPKTPKTGRKKPLRYQPQMALIVKLCERKQGATIEQLAAALGKEGKPIRQDTVRGSISRMSTAEDDPVVFVKVRHSRTLTYHVYPEGAPQAEVVDETQVVLH